MQNVECVQYNEIYKLCYVMFIGSESPWGSNKRETKYLDELGALETSDTFDQMFNEPPIEK